MKKGLLAISLLLAGAFSAQAKSGDGGVIYYTPGLSWSNPTALNQSLEQKNYSELGEMHFNQGVGFFSAFRNIVVGVEGQWLSGYQAKEGQSLVQSSGSYGLLHVGYLALNSGSYQLYPYLGVGYGGMQLSSTHNLNNVLGMTQGDLPLGRVEGQSWLLDIGLGTNWVAPLSSNSHQGIAMGARLGYLFSPLGMSWSSNDLPVEGGPDYTPDGFYLRFILGFGGFST